MKVEGIDHFHIGVKDLDAAVRFFSDLFDTAFSEIITSDGEGDAQGTVCDLGGVGVELVSSLTSDGWMAKLLEKRGEGCYGISFKVPSIDEARAELEARGLRVIRRTVVGKAIEAHIHPKDTYDTLIELCEYDAQLPAVLRALGHGYGPYQGSSRTGQPVKRNGILKAQSVDHIHIGVSDLDAGVAFFSNLLNIKFCAVLKSEPEDDTMATVGNLGGVGLELFTGLSPNGWMSQLLEKRGQGCYGISVRVPDIDEAIANLRARGLRVIRRTVVGGAIEAHIHPKDTYGIMIELIQYESLNAGVARALGKGYETYVAR